MHIHSYQILNVLNVFRNQLSQQPGTAMNRQASGVPISGNVIISKSHRNYLIERVSAEIVERISQAEPQEQSQGFKNEERSDPAGGVQNKEAAFTYSVIDENNCKISNTLPIEQLSPLNGRQREMPEDARGLP
jgi:hypothetical protein